MTELRERTETWEIGVCYARTNGKPLYCRGDRCRDQGHAERLLAINRECNPQLPADEFCILHCITEVLV